MQFVDKNNIAELINSTIAGKVRIAFDTCMISNINSQTITFNDIDATGCELIFDNVSNNANIVSSETQNCDHPNTTTITSDVFLDDVKETIKTELKKYGDTTIINNKIDSEINSQLMLNISTCIINNFNSQEINFSNDIFRCTNNEPMVISDITNAIDQIVVAGCTKSNTQKFTDNILNDNTGSSAGSNFVSTMKENETVIIASVFSFIFIIIICLIVFFVLRKKNKM